MWVELLVDRSRHRLTPLDVEQQRFARSWRGYDLRQVDDFLDLVQEELVRLHERIQQLQAQEHQPPEPSVAQVMVAAVRAADQTLTDARAEADRLLSDAREQAQRILADAHRQTAAVPELVAPDPAEAGRG